MAPNGFLSGSSMGCPYGSDVGFATGFDVWPTWVLYIEFPIYTVPVTHHIEYNRFGAVASFSSLTMISLQERCQMCSIAQW